jgi:hypothetical protein
MGLESPNRTAQIPLLTCACAFSAQLQPTGHEQQVKVQGYQFNVVEVEPHVA